MSEQPPDTSALTPEEWEAVRRLRERSAGSTGQTTPAPPTDSPAPSTDAATPTVESATAPPLPPVAPPPPPEQTEPPVWGGDRAPAGRSTPVALPALAALVVLAVVAAVLAAVVSARVSHNHAKNQAGTAALAAATNGVATVLSYNYKTLSSDFAKAEALLTPSFRKQYDATTAKGVEPLAAQYKAVSTAQVSAAGLISAGTSTAKVLVFVSQQVTNTQLSAPRLDRSRIEVELVHSKGQWLINKLNPV